MFQNHYCHCKIYKYIFLGYENNLLKKKKNYNVFALLAVSQQNYYE